MNASCGMSTLPNCRILLRSSPEVPTEHTRCDDGVVPANLPICQFRKIRKVLRRRSRATCIGSLRSARTLPAWRALEKTRLGHKSGGVRAEVDVCSAPNATGAEARLTGRGGIAPVSMVRERAPPITRPGDDGIVPVICPTRQMIS